MKKKGCKPILYGILVLLAGSVLTLSSVRAEDKFEIQNVEYTISVNTVTITYDLLGPADRDYKVTLILKKESQPAFMLNPKEISGDVGEDQNTGGGRRIVWEILKEFPAGLEGDDYYFKVDAEMMKKSSGIWWWIAGGAAVAGGTAAILLKSSPASGPTVNNVFPQPPPRP